MSVKLTNVNESIVMQMSQLAKQYNAIDLTQGYPDIETPVELKELAYKYIKSDNNQYASIEGVLELRQAIAKKFHAIYDIEASPETEITITSGAAEAIFSSITACVDEDDEVIIFEPAYDNYSPIVRLNGGMPIYVQLKHPNYSINWDEVNMNVTARTRMIILNSPHNPTGRIFGKEDFLKLSKIVNNSNIVVLFDEVYEHLIFEGQKHLSIASYPDLAKRSIIISSFEKSLSIAGWKIGYTLAPPELTKQVRKIHRFVSFSTNKPMQYAIAEYIKDLSVFEGIGKFYQAKRDLFLDLIKDTKFKALPVEGTFFQLLDYSAISDEKDSDFALRLVKDFGVAGIPTSELYHQKEDNKIIRICFAKPDEVLKEVATRLAKVE